MRFNKVIAYILRSWDKEPAQVHPTLKILPPFFYELTAYLLALALLYKLVTYIL
jgi:hypothetical protein